MMVSFIFLVLTPLFNTRFWLPYCVSLVFVVGFLSCSPDSLFLSCFVDEYSAYLITLSVYLLYLMVLSSGGRSRSLQILLVSINSILMAMFISSNIFIFYLFFELSLVPMMLIILGWGAQPERLVASVYMVFYTITSSLPFIAVVIFLGCWSFDSWGSFYLSGLGAACLSAPMLVKTPMYFFHIWLPKAHVEAPVYGSMVLAAILLKIGPYGLWRMFCFMPSNFGVFVGLCSIFASGVCAAITFFQVDIKSLIAYSSVVHMALIVFSVYVCFFMASICGLLMMIAHGVCSSGLFYLATVMYTRVNSRSTFLSSGLMAIAPSLSAIWSLLLLMNLSAPPSLSLLSELFMVGSSMGVSPASIIPLGLMLVLVLCYSLNLFYNYSHNSVVSLLSPAPANNLELSIGGLHSIWWALSPLVFFLIEWLK